MVFPPPAPPALVIVVVFLVNLFRSVHVFDFSFAAAGAAGFGARVYGNLFATGMFSCGFPKEPPTNENSAGMPRVIIMIAFENLCNFRFCLDLFSNAMLYARPFKGNSLIGIWVWFFNGIIFNTLNVGQLLKLKCSKHLLKLN